eukprot:1360721-Rhodomonas_salina.1
MAGGGEGTAREVRWRVRERERQCSQPVLFQVALGYVLHVEGELLEAEDAEEAKDILAATRPHHHNA